MATNFPTSLDSLTNPTASDKLNSVTVPHASQHATLNDAVEALEAKVGVDGSAVTTSHDYLIAKQSVVPYDDASARTTAVPSPIEGQMSYLKDTNSVEVYDGSAWAAVGGGLSYGTATGGSSSTITVGGESYTLLTFTTSGNLTVTADGVFDFVIVGGGGKGGEGYYSDSSGGGGGGGGVITGTVGLTAGTHAIVIGAGGTTNVGGNGLPGEPGSPSSLGAIEAVGGGGGGGYLIAQGNSYVNFKGYVMVGASGGGTNANFLNQIAAPAIGTQQGNDGGTATTGASSGGGGGGGYGSAGGNASGGTGGAGGNGYDPTTFTGSTITTAFGAGGGGAGSSTGGTGGSSSAGGDGGGATNGSNAANYGNGGGGADYSFTGGNGSNGIVLVRFKN